MAKRGALFRLKEIERQQRARGPKWHWKDRFLWMPSKELTEPLIQEVPRLCPVPAEQEYHQMVSGLLRLIEAGAGKEEMVLKWNRWEQLLELIGFPAGETMRLTEKFGDLMGTTNVFGEFRMDYNLSYCGSGLFLYTESKVRIRWDRIYVCAVYLLNQYGSRRVGGKVDLYA